MKDLIILGDGSVIENINFMESNADDIGQNYSYQRILTDDEIDAERIEFATASIAIAQLEEEKQRVNAEINERLKAKKELAKTSLMLIRVGRSEVRETVYFIKDETEGKVGTYTQDGTLISERPLKPTERQRRIFNAEPLTYKTGTSHGD